MQANPYLGFDGQCEAAFNFYARCLGGEVGQLFRYAGTPMADKVPVAWQDKIMHGSVTAAGLVLMGADIAPGQYEAPRGFSLSVQMPYGADAERIFLELGQGGRVVAEFEKTFWAERFGVVVDRFGLQWVINCE